MMKKNFSFDKIFLFLYASLFFVTSLIMLPFTSELFEFNKIIFIYLIFSLIAFFWLLKMIYLKKIIIKKTPFDIPIILFLVSQIVSTIFSIDPHTSIFGYYGRFNGGLLSIIVYILLFYGFVSNFPSEKIKLLLKISLISSFLVIIWGLPGKFGHDLTCLLFMGEFNNSCWTAQFRPAERVFSTLGQPNWLAAYLAIHFFIGLYFAIREVGKLKIVYLLYLPLNFLFIIFTRSRSALLAVVISLILLTLSLLYQKSKKLFFVTLGIIIFVLVIFTLVKKEQLIKSIAVNISSSSVTDSFEIRKIVWKGAIDLGLKYPLFGTGVETFAYSYYFVRPQKHNLTSEWDFLYNKAHNEYLNYLATTGFVGLTAYLLMIASIFFFVFKKHVFLKNQPLTFFLILAYLSILITNFFGFSTTTINLFFYLIPGMLILDNQKMGKMAISQKSVINKLSSGQVLLVGFSLLVTFYWFFFVFCYWYADFLYAKADLSYKSGQYQLATNLFQQSLKFKYEHVFEDKLSSSLANLAVLAAYQKQMDLAKKLISLSQFYNQKALSASKKNVLYFKTKAKNEYLFYQATLEKKYLFEAIKTLDYAFTLSPTDAKIPYTLAGFYSLLTDETNDKAQKIKYAKLSLEKINQALNLKPNFTEALSLKTELEKKFKTNL